VLIERIVAPNPGPMTLTGTNTYVLGDAAGHLALVDPGPVLPAHLEAIRAAVRRLGRVVAVIVTHRHLDHLPAADPLCQETGAPLVGHPALPGVQRPARDGESVFNGVVAVDTPGHTRDSLSLWCADEGALFTGDLVLGTGTAVLDEAPGALTDYLASLDRLIALQPAKIYPGHGPIVADGVGKLTEYRAHRQQRVQEVVATLTSRGASTADELAAAIYTTIPPSMLPMAARNVRANLEMLQSQRRAERLADDRWRLVAI
jgi:glyoxylase-like metal-dependent hydrolase (beta-lactamase superfamily II)